MRRLLCVVGLLLAISLHSHAAEETTPEQSLARAVDYLWSQQQDDGSWRSEQYAVLRSGQALTPFLLHTLLQSSDTLSSHDVERAMRAVQFIVKHLDADGAIGRSDPDILEYPVYSTAYALMAIEKLQRHGNLLRKQGDLASWKMQEFLAKAQFNEDDGFKPEMPAYGGWGFDQAQSPGDSGHMDLAHTRRVLEALAVANRRLPAFADFHCNLANRAQCFLRVVQKHPSALAGQPMPDGAARPNEIPFDGGFYFSPVVLAANKGRMNEDGNCWQSYATATCDGILALLASGVPRDDQRIIAAVDWLKKHTNLDYPQGVPTDHPEPWGEAIQFYHYATRAEVFRALDFPVEERAKLAAAVARHQREVGSFVNTVSPLMKEDEPLLATALAVVALSHCR